MEQTNRQSSSRKGKALAVILFLLCALMVVGIGTTFALFSKSETVTVSSGGGTTALVIGAEGARN